MCAYNTTSTGIYIEKKTLDLVLKLTSEQFIAVSRNSSAARFIIKLGP